MVDLENRRVDRRPYEGYQFGNEVGMLNFGHCRLLMGAASSALGNVAATIAHQSVRNCDGRGPYSSGTPAMRRPSYMRSRPARKFGLSLTPTARKRRTVKPGSSVS